MPRGRGGPRVGQPGVSYPQRTDLAANRADFKGQTYGTGVQQAAEQAAGAQASSPPGAGALFGGQHPVPPGVPAPGEFPDLFAPTQRPGEPVTHGMPFGAGAGPEILSQPSPGEDYMGQLRAVYQRFPTEALRELIAFNSTGGV